MVLDVTVPAKASVAPTVSQKMAEFRTLVEKVRAFYSTVCNLEDPEFDLPAMSPLISESGRQPFLKEAAPLPPPNPDPTLLLSSLGKIDNFIQHQYVGFDSRDKYNSEESPKHTRSGYGKLQVGTTKNPMLFAAKYRTSISLFLSGWKGRRELDSSWNQAWWDEAKVMGILEGLIETVEVGLGVDEGDYGTESLRTA